MGGNVGTAVQRVMAAQQEESNRRAQQENQAAYDFLTGRSDLVTDAYQNILGRNPEPSGLDYHTRAMAGMNTGDFVRGFAQTPEFRQAQDYQEGFTQIFRPGYQQFAPNQQFYPSIYRPSYTDYGIEGARNFPQPGYSYSLRNFNPQTAPSYSIFNPQTAPSYSIPFPATDSTTGGNVVGDGSYDFEIGSWNPHGDGAKQGGVVDEGIVSLLKK